ncbi:MAG: DUF2807 domain-containing protein [Bacteroidota bacterium]
MLVLILGCDSENAWNCVQKVGDIQEFEFDFDETILRLEVYDDFSVVLHPSSTQRVVVQTGKNLINEVEVAMPNDSTLLVCNHNNCNWTRRPDNMTLHFYTDQLEYFEKLNFGEVRTGGQLALRNFEIVTKASGNVTLDITCEEQLFVKMFSLSNIKVTGTTPLFRVGIDPKIDGRLDALDLQTPRVSFYHSGTNDMMIRASEAVSGSIRSFGDVHLYGDPPDVDVLDLGLGGRLLMMNP